MSKYESWREFLETIDADEIVVTFQQLDKIAPLPRSAHLESCWWANDVKLDNGAAQAKAWLGAGYHAHPNMKEKCVSFRKVGSRPKKTR